MRNRTKKIIIDYQTNKEENHRSENILTTVI